MAGRLWRGTGRPAAGGSVPGRATVSGYRLPATGYRPSAIGHRLRAAGCRGGRPVGWIREPSTEKCADPRRPGRRVGRPVRREGGDGRITGTWAERGAWCPYRAWGRRPGVPSRHSSASCRQIFVPFRRTSGRRPPRPCCRPTRRASRLTRWPSAPPRPRLSRSRPPRLPPRSRSARNRPLRGQRARRVPVPPPPRHRRRHRAVRGQVRALALRAQVHHGGPGRPGPGRVCAVPRSPPCASPPDRARVGQQRRRIRTRTSPRTARRSRTGPRTRSRISISEGRMPVLYL